MFQPIHNPVPPFNSEYQIVEERLYEGLLTSCNECHSTGITHAYVREIPNFKIASLKTTSSKLDKFRKAGLIGCLNDTGLTSENYKKEIYKKS